MEKKMNKALAGKILNQLREEAISEGVIKNFIQGIEDYFKKYGFVRIEDIDEAHIASETMDLTNTKYTLDIDEEDVHTYHVEFWTPKSTMIMLLINLHLSSWQQEWQELQTTKLDLGKQCV